MLSGQVRFSGLKMSAEIDQWQGNYEDKHNYTPYSIGSISGDINSRLRLDGVYKRPPLSGLKLDGSERSQMKRSRW